ncbi:NIPSNAP family containing protein [Pontibacter qinzhouensis]|uniref:NIPSNAP family containing protein n=1 Tax=Pontibacter qinzhouensis TaxID=2603253 RepID=A0A5C8JKC6_9BACT|nr:NIPSNAP family protein [Pontibacter qinzhouensis]TXK37892.1 NIPSNAP family containing protein [Pontibacter qinzhouensis]
MHVRTQSFRQILFSTALCLFCLVAAFAATAQRKGAQEYYELRKYTFQSEQQQQLTEEYLKSAAIPALNRLGSKTVGVFKEMEVAKQPVLFVLIPFASLQQYSKVTEQLEKDAAYQLAAKPYLEAAHTNPAYLRIESSLLLAFKDMPVLEVPKAASQNQERMFELRTYESHSEASGKKKVHMFNEGGEIPIFRRTGLTPVFFGETLIGPQRPNLTYMLTFKNKEDLEQSWKKFSADPEWKKLSAMPEYAHTVSHITKYFLVPASYSQL